MQTKTQPKNRKKRVSSNRKGKHLSWEERLSIERLLLEKKSKKEIAEAIGCCVATVYNEIKRYTYPHTVGAKDYIRYSPDASEELYCKNLCKKGKTAKLLLDVEQRLYLEDLIVNQEYSPAAALMQAKKDGKEFLYPVKSVNTIYKAIKDGLFENVTLDMLPEQGKYGRKRNKRRNKQRNKQNNGKVQKKASKGDSIEKRPENILKREAFGHWEMDTVVGSQRNKKNILVLTERKTRMELLLLLKNHTTDEVRKALNRLEKRFGRHFYTIFKSITVDNGVEFSGYNAIEKALYRKGNRTKLYFCHPYAPHERGSNEVQNKMIRRVYGKKANFDMALTKEGIMRTQKWINNYPRALLGGKSSFECFEKELLKLGIVL